MNAILSVPVQVYDFGYVGVIFVHALLFVSFDNYIQQYLLWVMESLMQQEVVQLSFEECLFHHRRLELSFVVLCLYLSTVMRSQSPFPLPIILCLMSEKRLRIVLSN